MNKLKRTNPVFLNRTVDDAHLIKPLPVPTGDYPFRLDIRKVLGENTCFLHERMSFHMVGDTGSVRPSAFQPLLAAALTTQAEIKADAGEQPAFLFHLGDVVYNHGEAREYPKQFLLPYESYPGPIFAIAGNHDADVNPDSELVYQSLDAFMDVFCDTYSRRIVFGGDSKRRSMVQPHVYWTLETPLARFIGLYANVTKYGTIDEEQRLWFIDELRHAAIAGTEQAIIVCLHQAPYSADTNHGSSAPMIAFLESAFKAAGVKPDAVFSGHVHNYQRFTKSYEDGTVVPYIVAGAGGYADLHPIAASNDPRVEEMLPDIHQVRLENYCDDCYGFLYMTIEKNHQGLTLIGEYHTLAPDALHQTPVRPNLFERFVIPLQRPVSSHGQIEAHPEFRNIY